MMHQKSSAVNRKISGRVQKAESCVKRHGRDREKKEKRLGILTDFIKKILDILSIAMLAFSSKSQYP